MNTYYIDTSAVFLFADDRLVQAATAENVPVDNPNQHP